MDIILENKLNFLLPFSTREGMIGVPKPKCFAERSLNNLRAIIDCTNSMWKNLASHQVKGLHIVNINPQTDFNYLFQDLPFCMSTFCFNYTVAVSVTRRL